MNIEKIKSELLKLWPGVDDEVIEFFVDCMDADLDLMSTGAYLHLKKPYGSNTILKNIKGYGLSYVVMNPHQSTSYHKHGKRKEFFLVKEGVLTLTNGNKITKLTEGKFDSSTPGQPHSLSNTNENVLKILEIFCPFLLDDKYRIKDQYDRKLGDVIFKE